MRLSGQLRGAETSGDSELLIRQLQNALTEAGAEGVTVSPDGVRFVFCSAGGGQTPVHLGPGRFSLDLRNASLIDYEIEVSLLATLGPLVFICPVAALIALFLGVHWAVVVLILVFGSVLLLLNCSLQTDRWLNVVEASAKAATGERLSEQT